MNVTKTGAVQSGIHEQHKKTQSNFNEIRPTEQGPEKGYEGGLWTLSKLLKPK